ncbi:MAG: aspartoacylase [Waterburya sp.]
MMTQINTVLLSAGIHGNEKTGIYLVKKFQENKELASRKSFITKTLLINTKAIKLNRRYCEIDLNRCFDLKNINNPDINYYEKLLAQKTYQQVQELKIDFVLDFHTSTSNMGLTLLLSSNKPFNLQLAAYLALRNPLVKIVCTPNNKDKNRFRNIFPLGFTVEMGAIAPNVVDPIWFKRAEELVIQILDYIEGTNQQQQSQFASTITVYSLFKTIYFPTDNQGEITGMVHPQLHGNDYCALNPDEPMFLTFDGNSIFYQGKDTVYPLFINETAYWEQKIAMYLATKEEIEISAVQN